MPGFTWVLTSVLGHAWIYMCSEDLNSGSQAYEACDLTCQAIFPASYAKFYAMLGIEPRPS